MSLKLLLGVSQTQDGFTQCPCLRWTAIRNEAALAPLNEIRMNLCLISYSIPEIP